MLGKRKTRPSEEPGEDDDSAAAARALLRKHFEARFKPLAVSAAPATPESKRDADDSDSEGDDYGSDQDKDTVSDDQSESEWEGVSEDGQEEDSDSRRVEVVDHTVAQPVITSSMTKRELKAYLSSRPPSHAALDAAQKETVSAKKASKEDEDSAAFLANDLALQRLISESHILAAAGGNSSHYLSTSAEASAAANNKTFVEGRTRRKTTDLRIQALGAKQSILAQSKMPMGMRKGINQTALSREEKRRREAKENGIILERQSAGGKMKAGGSSKKRSGEQPVDLPGVGRMRGAELRISARDVRSIEASGPRGPKEKSRKKSRGRRK
ncbi:hypothetical protein B0H66DRAFT_363858 [Apodospora peruviana]|uniref:Protein FAF1 n=1 Tax=Apodospora peruviana TaxID=516989 RepID=A0AAE0LZU1_9PEZI|nr:hypothetical protein B0H66DRAFT_363858 [Apodospora peruviana]